MLNIDKFIILPLYFYPDLLLLYYNHKLMEFYINLYKSSFQNYEILINHFEKKNANY
jgi:hypothetical protein